jgi:hypothetical protein
MSINAGNGPNKAQFLKAPLLTLTVPRIIASAMGNIIRQLYADLNAPGTVPASEGLESSD